MKKKGALIAACGIIAAVGIGITFALSGDRSVINGALALGGYLTSFTDTFSSPAGWQTCQTVPKTITATNNNTDISIAVRVKLEEDWIASDGTTHLPLVSAASGLTMAQINFTQNSGWTKIDDWYVYDTDLAPGASTSSLITDVTLSCDANLDQSDNAEATADGAYADAEYHLKATIQTIQADKKAEWLPPTLADAIIEQANAPYEIDYRRKAIVSNDEYTRNGNGVNKYTENGQDVYYFRGQIDNNNVIWADICWKIIRTTATGGVKMVYNGEPTVVGEVKQCNATGLDAQLNATTYKFNNYDTSPADVGYKYGVRIAYASMSAGSGAFTFSNDVSKNGNTYTLDTNTGQSIYGTWADERFNAATRYHYFCTDGASTCDNTKIGYIIYFGVINSNNPIIYYLPLSGYEDIEAAKDAMFANTNDSAAKTTIESWFESKNLDGHIPGSRNYEDDLEDAVFCNDRSYYSGALKGKDSDATPRSVEITNYTVNFHGAYGRNFTDQGWINVKPSLDCTNSRDAFQVSNNNAKLKHKVGLITADELTITGHGDSGNDITSYLYNTSQNIWSMSPEAFLFNTAAVYYWQYFMGSQSVNLTHQGIRPVVSLKSGTWYSSGSGLKTDPYIIP